MQQNVESASLGRIYGGPRRIILTEARSRSRVKTRWFFCGVDAHPLQSMPIEAELKDCAVRHESSDYAKYDGDADGLRVEIGMSEVRSLVVGASGQVGTQMLGMLGAEKTLATSRVAREGWLTMDLAELAGEADAAAALDSLELDAIYCVGGMTNVDACESEPDVAERTNARGPGVLAGYAKTRGVPYVYFSTEYVFDGSKEHPGPYLEDSEPRPLSVYGRTKLLGEQRVLAANPAALVLRTTVVYGPDPREKNYVYSLMRNLAGGTAMRVPEDQVSTPTYNRDLIAAMMALLEARVSGIFHVCGPEVMGRLTFARQVAQALGLDAALLQGMSTAELGQVAPRPLDAGLATQKLKEVLPSFSMHTVEQAIEKSLPEFRSFIQRTLIVP